MTGEPFFHGRAAIVGVGQTEFSKKSGRSELQLAAEAAKAAIEEAGLTPADIDGAITFSMDSNDELHLSRALGIPELSWLSRSQPPGGAGANQVVRQAAAAVASGAATNVLIYRAFNERSEKRFGLPTDRGVKPTQNFRLPFALDTPAKIYGLDYQRYMYDFGLTNADFGLYSVSCRRYAATNPAAWFYQRPITLDDHQASRWIAEPVLRLLDCCQESDGGCALVVTSAERARDLRQPGVLIRSFFEHFPSSGVDIMPDYLRQRHRDDATARRAWAELGIGPRDVQVAMIYDNFSPVVFMRLEEFGFCGIGEARDFIADGNIDIDGILPVNTNGGLIGEAYIHGINNIIEAVRQVRGTAVNQVARVERAAVIVHGVMLLERMA